MVCDLLTKAKRRPFRMLPHNGEALMGIVRRLAGLILFALAAVTATLCLADDYPSHPVRIIIGFGAGASADTPARLLAQKFSDALGQQFLVENRPGAGSNVAAEYVARAPK